MYEGRTAAQHLPRRPDLIAPNQQVIHIMSEGVSDPTQLTKLFFTLVLTLFLLAKGTIGVIAPHIQSKGFYSIYLVVPKKNLGLCPIGVLSLPHVMVVLCSVGRDGRFTFLDLKDTYIHVYTPKPCISVQGYTIRLFCSIQGLYQGPSIRRVSLACSEQNDSIIPG